MFRLCSEAVIKPPKPNILIWDPQNETKQSPFLVEIVLCTPFDSVQDSLKAFYLLLKPTNYSFFVSGQNHPFYNNTKYLQLHVRRKLSVSKPTNQAAALPTCAHVSFQMLKRYNTAAGLKFNTMLAPICYGFDVYFTC